VVLHGRALFVISDFLNKNLPSLLGKPSKEEPLSKVVAPLADKFPSQIQVMSSRGPWSLGILNLVDYFPPGSQEF